MSPPKPKPADPAARLRAICLDLPAASEVVIRRGPTYRVNDKIFALDRTVERRPSLWCKVPAGGQAALIGADPKRFFSPPYYGAKGWIGLWLDRDVDWEEVAGLVARSHRLIAPKRSSVLGDQR